jgi:hypothetical protein
MATRSLIGVREQGGSQPAARRNDEHCCQEAIAGEEAPETLPWIVDEGGDGVVMTIGIVIALRFKARERQLRLPRRASAVLRS